MWRAIAVGLLFLAFVTVDFKRHERGGATESKTVSESKVTFDDLVAGRVRIIDLTYTINDKNPYWPGDNYEPFKLKTIATIEKNGVLSKVFSMPEHLGTHIDAPNHFEKDQPSVDQIAAGKLFAAGVVIDISAKCEQESDSSLTLEDIKNWEQKHGRIPGGAVVLLNTGWSRHWSNIARYQNKDIRGKLHFPGFSAEAAKFLVERRNVKGIGLDTLSIDRGLSRDFVVHHIVNGAGKYGIENLANLNKLPPRGFYLFVAPIKIETGTGGPARVFAILPQK